MLRVARFQCKLSLVPVKMNRDRFGLVFKASAQLSNRE